MPSCVSFVCQSCSASRSSWRCSPWRHPLFSEEVFPMPYDSIELGHRLITLMAAAMLVVQMLLAGQRLLPTVIALFSLQSLFLACLAAAVAYVNHAHHVYIAAGLTLVLKVVVMPLILQRIIRQTGT